MGGHDTYMKLNVTHVSLSGNVLAPVRYVTLFFRFYGMHIPEYYILLERCFQVQYYTFRTHRWTWYSHVYKIKHNVLYLCVVDGCITVLYHFSERCIQRKCHVRTRHTPTTCKELTTRNDGVGKDMYHIVFVEYSLHCTSNYPGKG